MLLGLFCALATPAWGEMYVDLAGGVNLNTPQPTSLAGGPALNRELATNPAYGIRIGGFGRYVGGELEYLHLSPWLKQARLPQWPAPITNPILGRRLELDTVSFLLLLRYPGQRIQPFLGAGPTLVLAELGGNACEDIPGNCGVPGPMTAGAFKTTTLGATVKAGAVIPVGEHWAFSLSLQTLLATAQFPGPPWGGWQGAGQPVPNFYVVAPGERLHLAVTTATLGLRYQFDLE